MILPAEKNCKYTLRYKECGERGSQACDMIYVLKSDLRTAFGHFPPKIKITIEEAT